MTIENLGLKKRILNSLHRAGVYSIEGLCSLYKDDLTEIRDIGPVAIREIENRLWQLDEELAGNYRPAGMRWIPGEKEI